MNRGSAKVLAIGLCLAASALLVACGNNDESSSTSTAASSSSSGGSSADLSLAEAGDLGQVLIGPDGNTVYLFEKDTSADASTCSGACAKEWPPLTVKGRALAGDGVDAAKLTTLKRDDGSTQIAYNGHPLYFYAGDTAPGDTNGNDIDEFGAEWYAVTAAGDSAGDGGSADASSTTSPSVGY